MNFQIKIPVFYHTISYFKIPGDIDLKQGFSFLGLTLSHRIDKYLYVIKLNKKG